MDARQIDSNHTKTKFIWMAVCRVARVWREMLFIAAFVAMVVTDDDVAAMVSALPPIFVGVCAAYAYAVWRTHSDAGNTTSRTTTEADLKSMRDSPAESAM